MNDAPTSPDTPSGPRSDPSPERDDGRGDEGGGSGSSGGSSGSSGGEPISKREMVRRLADRHDLTQVEVQNVVQGTLDLILQALVEQGRLELRNFGVFEVTVRKARKARNPKTNTPVRVPERRVVVFKPSSHMRDLIE